MGVKTVDSCAQPLRACVGLTEPAVGGAIRTENCRRGIIMWFKPPPPPPPPPLPFLLSRTAFDTAIFILCVSFFVAWIYGTIRKCSCKKLTSSMAEITSVPMRGTAISRAM